MLTSLVIKENGFKYKSQPPTHLVIEPTGSPSYSSLNLCTTFVIKMYNSSRAKRCPMHDLQRHNKYLQNSFPEKISPGSVAKRKV